MQKYLFAVCVLAASVAQANDEWNPTPKDLLLDQADGTDVFAIPLDESDVEDEYEMKEMREEQAEYFKKHPEAYKRWIQNRANAKP